MPVTVKKWRNGPLRARLDANREALAFYRQGERNALLKMVMKRCINEWRFEHLKKRIQKKNVLKPPFNYADDPVSPMVQNRILLKQIWKGKIRVTATKGNPKGKLALPFGHPVTDEITRVFNVLPPDEMDWFADRFGEILEEEFKKSVHVQPKRRNSRPRMQLSPQQRQRAGVKTRKRRRSRGRR